MESDLQNDNKRDRYCSDGKPVLTFDDGWTWFGISEGFSAQRGCCNETLWKWRRRKRRLSAFPSSAYRKARSNLLEAHLTFILNNGYLGEMKGFANQKPHSESWLYREFTYS